MKFAFIQTGGSIDKKYPTGKGTYFFEIGEPAFEEILDKVNPNFEYKFIPLLKKDSLDFDDNDRELISNKCNEIDIERIIITHGTDCMIDTAKYLDSRNNGKIIILTGASLPESVVGTDADFNLGVAVGAIQFLKPGIYIAMSGNVYKWTEVIKSESGMFVYKK